MGKKSITFVAMVGMTAGSFIPMLWGDDSLLGGWSLLGGLIGGIFGVWLGVKLSKRFG